MAERLVLQLSSLEREELHVLLLNSRNVVVRQERIYVGNVSAALVRVSELFTEAVRFGALGYTTAAPASLCSPRKTRR